MTKPASSRELYLRLLQYVRPYWKAIVLSLCATAIMAATEPMFPALLKPLLDEGFTQQGGGMENPLLIPLGIVGVFLLRGVFNYFSSYGFSWVSNRVIADIRAEMYARMDEDMDINTGDILEGVTLEDKGREMFEMFIRVASGEVTKSEALGFGGAEFVPWQIGAVM